MRTHTIFVLYLCLVSTKSFAHSGHIFSHAIEACENKQISQKCSYIVGGEKYYTGTCQVLNEVKMCVRNQPVKTIDADSATVPKNNTGNDLSDDPKFQTLNEIFANQGLTLNEFSVARANKLSF